MVSFPGAMQADEALTRRFRERDKDETGHLVHDVCCASACVPLDVRSTGNAVPRDHVVAPLCIAAPEGGTSVPAPGRADCPQAIKLPGYDHYAPYNDALTQKEGPDAARRAGFPEQATCCYDGLRPAKITR